MVTDDSINANPTKTFFIGMLTKDIELSRAIMDLIDNCVDGALRTKTDRKFKGLWVKLKVNEKEFSIADNCGGISVDLAREYAFRFGRPEEMQSIDHSIGQFGVGMKRALFKLGSKFIIESKTKHEKFSITINVDEWKKNSEWKFYFTNVAKGLDIPEEEQGTSISVTDLHTNVAEDFKSATFITKLRLDIMRAHQIAIEDGLSVSLNEFPIDVEPLTFLCGDELKPVKIVEKYGEQDNIVDVRIYAGVADKSPTFAGWYVYCNGRMVLEADQTLTTGWGEGGGSSVPKYHNTYARFRGFVFFESAKASLLPWNTTKTGVDTDSPMFRAVRQKMITLMQQVFTFLKAVSKETAYGTSDEKPLTDYLVKRAKTETIAMVGTSDKTFVFPHPLKKTPEKPKPGYIRYDRPVNKVEKVKKILEVESYKEVGERTFDYFYEREVEEN